MSFEWFNLAEQMFETISSELQFTSYASEFKDKFEELKTRTYERKGWKVPEKVDKKVNYMVKRNGLWVPLDESVAQKKDDI